MDELAIYIHIPYCGGICPYCDFHSAMLNIEEKDSYIKAVLSFLDSQPFGEKKTKTLFFGGGTPTIISPRELGEIIKKVHSVFPFTSDAEITLEANPESVTKEKLAQLFEIGFTRISFGIQSLVEKELSALGRLHGVEQGKNSILWAKEVGFSHISADMMLNIPYQSLETALYTVRELVKLPIDHISAYMLTVEVGAPFETSPLIKHVPLEDQEADIYLGVVAELEKNDFRQYEISNFAKTGGISRHNLKYWLSEDYLGIGPSAHSYVHGERFSFPNDTRGFIENSGNWNYRNHDGQGGDWEEYAMLRLRLVPGLDTVQLKRRYPQVDTGAMLERAGKLGDYVRVENGVITLTPKGFLLSLPVTYRIMEED